MKNRFERLTTGAVCILAVSLIVIFAGCQQSQEKQTTGVSRKDRLVANENLDLKNEITRCQEEIEKQKNLVSQCEKEKEEMDRQANETMKWLMDELPKDLLDDASKLSEENANLTAKIAELEKALKESNSQPQQK